MDIETELDYLRNEVNRLKLKDMKDYEKLISVYSIKKEEPKLIVLNDKIFYINKNILTDELGFIKGKIENDNILWLNEEELG
jgi:hypothetical protein